ncbi:tetratricopeptide repeat protein [Acinetobacter sp. Ac_5812]|uniref:tetratricopeptide repeat protein n=1 Tax=Acinetobacter sp. Ac_5812 TaxID=1848937 RepID=UPI0014903BDA|nr:tetratricopeptide repeat protein [Acinetobacter sp. Ac_5812]NNP67413.1 hypothetical protein [Acinetobacter sp. Ac_5812]
MFDFKKIVFIFTVFFLVFSSACNSKSTSGISEAEKKEYVSKYQAEMDSENYKGAFSILEKLVEKNDDFAKNEMGFFYEKGIFVEKDIKKAIKLYAEAGNNNYVPAMYNISRLKLEDGNSAEALSILKKIESDNYAPAINLLGIMYNNGDYVDKDLNKAFLYYKKAADLGNPDAKFNLGQMYFYGEGVKQDYKKSFYWYDESAKQNYDFAKIQLATSYYKGYGVEKNVEKAINVISEMAEKGDPDAIYNIRLYYKSMNDNGKYEYWDIKCKETIGCE